jgi:hypothetical protein
MRKRVVRAGDGAREVTGAVAEARAPVTAYVEVRAEAPVGAADEQQTLPDQFARAPPPPLH